MEDVCAPNAIFPHFEECQGGKPVKNQDGKYQTSCDGLKGPPDNENGSCPQAVSNDRPGRRPESGMDMIQPFKEEPISGHGIISPCRGHHGPIDASGCGDDHKDGDEGATDGTDQRFQDIRGDNCALPHSLHSKDSVVGHVC